MIFKIYFDKIFSWVILGIDVLVIDKQNILFTRKKCVTLFYLLLLLIDLRIHAKVWLMYSQPFSAIASVIICKKAEKLSLLNV